MSASQSPSEVVLTLAEEFLERYRQGERPSLKEYIDRRPDLAAEIRQVFPAMALMEKIALRDESLASALTGDELPEPRGADATPLARQLGDYRIVREVGRGGMGIVYEAVQESLGRHVALKVLPQTTLLDARQKQRFEREARAAAKLHHTNIVPVFGVGAHDGVPFYAMQFIRGQGLDVVLDELRRLPADAPKPATDPTTDTVTAVPRSHSSSTAVLPGQSGDQAHKLPYWKSVAEVGVQVASALEYAHRQGVLHRDIKPSNLLLDAAGTVWITDFGLAKADDQPQLTGTGDILGTLRYMPPEAFDGRADARSDVYSLGLTLYEMVALRPAFDEADRNKLVKQVMAAEPTRLERLNRPVPRDLATVVHKAIDRDPARRYATAAELAEDLRRFVADEPVRAQRVTYAGRAWRWCRRNPAVAGLLLTVASLLVAGSGISALFAVKAHREQVRATDNADKANANADRANVNAEEAQRHAAEAERNLYIAHMQQIQLEWDKANVGRIRDLLDRYRNPPPGQKDPRGWEWHYWERMCQGDLRTLTGHTGSVLAVAFHPDGSQIASAGADGTVRLWETGTGRLLHTLQGHKGRVSSIAFSPDGQLLASGSEDKTVRLWQVTAGREVRILTDHKASVLSVAFAPDGKTLASGMLAQSERKLWDVATGQLVRTFTARVPASAYCLKFRPDGKQLACAGGPDVELWEVATGRLAQTLSGHRTLYPNGRNFKPVTSIAYSPNGNVMASGSADQTIKLWELSSGREMRTLKGHTDAVRAVVFSPDGTHLVSAGMDRTIKLWVLASGETAPTLRDATADVTNVIGHTAGVMAVAFSQDGMRLASASVDQSVKVWASRGSLAHLPVLAKEGQYTGAVFSGDGTLLAVSSFMNNYKQAVEVQELGSGRRRHLFADQTRPFAFSPNGRWLATTSRDRVVKTWDLNTGRELMTLKSGPSGSALAFGPGETTLATTAKDRITLWDPYTGGTRETLDSPGLILSVEISRDGKLLAAKATRGNDGSEIRLWDVESGRLLHTFRASSIAVSPDGRTLALGDAEKTVRVFDLTAGQEARRLEGQQGAVVRVTFSPDGKRLASLGRDGKLWDLSTGGLLATVPDCRSLAFDGEGVRLFSTDLEVVKVWNAATGDLLGSVPMKGDGIAVDPTGQRLAVWSPLEVTLCDVRPLTAELAIRREAHHLVISLCDIPYVASTKRPLRQQEVVARIRELKTICEAVRQESVALVEQVYDADAQALRFQNESEKLSLKRNQPPEQYRQALAWAQTACELDPDFCFNVAVLGLAFYRNGHHEKAVEVLLRAIESAKKQAPSLLPVFLTWLAMAQYEAGQKDSARATLASALEDVSGSAEAIPYLREAQALIEGKKE